MFDCFNEEILAYKNGTSATVSMGDWFKLMLISWLSCIPFVGFIVAIVSYIVIAFKRETAPSIANYLKMMLIYALVSMIIGIIIVCLLGALFAGAFSSAFGAY